MMPEKYEAFMKWYLANYPTHFLIDTEIEDYCGNDTEILLHVLVALHNLFLKIADNVNIFEDSITLCKGLKKDKNWKNKWS
jgi:hypothetical protein